MAVVFAPALELAPTIVHLIFHLKINRSIATKSSTMLLKRRERLPCMGFDLYAELLPIARRAMLVD